MQPNGKSDLSKVEPSSSTRAPAGTNCAAKETRASRPESVCTAILGEPIAAFCAVPDRAQTGGESSWLRNYAIGGIGKRVRNATLARKLEPERRQRFLQNAAKPHRRDAFGKPGLVVGFDGDRAHRRRAACRLEFRPRQLAQKP